jgi:Tol biopolymer transport system component
MFARFRASRLVLCSLAILLLVAACVPIPPPAPSPATSTGSPAPAQPAPVADRLVFARHEGGNGAGGLFVVDVPRAGATGPLSATQLTTDGGYWSVVSPDGQWIAYLVEVSNPEIWLVSIDGRKQFNMTQGAASSSEPAWSPHGSQIAFASNGGIWIQDVAPILAGQAPPPRKLVDVGNSPRWSPDGTQIAYLADKKGDNFTQLYTIKPDGTGERQLTAHTSDGNGSGILAPAWQPDGRWMIVPMYFGPNCQLVLLPVDGTTAPIPDDELRIVTPDEEFAEGPAWEANGRWVAFHAGRNPTTIAVMDMQSGEVRHIAPELAGIFPTWAPDGSRLVFTATGQAPDYNQEIYVIDRDGSNPVNVTASPAAESNPAWSPPNQPPGS